MITFEKLSKLFKDTDDPDVFDVLGHKFNNFEKAQTLDSYCILRDMGIFNLPSKILLELIPENEIKENIGFRILLSFILSLDDIVIFLLIETDKRLISIINTRIKYENKGLDLDCKLII